jgi:hypothetical protein
MLLTAAKDRQAQNKPGRQAAGDQIGIWNLNVGHPLGGVTEHVVTGRRQS